MLILSFLSLFTVQSIQRALQTKRKVQGQIDKNSNLRDALRIIERDINMAFNYRDVYVELYNQTQKARQTKATGKTDPANEIDPLTGLPKSAPSGNNPSPSANTSEERFKPKPVKVYSQFLGGEDSLDLTTLSNVRMTEDSPISMQAEVGYKLKPCRRRSNQEASSKCLWRRTSNYIHDDITRNGRETVLLENVTAFELRYLGPGREQEWVKLWYTNERGDDVTKGKFPYAVEITLAIKEEGTQTKDKELRMTTVAAVRNPNNPPVADPNNPAAAGAEGEVDPNGAAAGAGGDDGAAPDDAGTPGGGTSQ